MPDNPPPFDNVPGQFGAILIDPPWRFVNRTGKMAPEHKRLHRYPTMSFDEIAALPVGALAAPQAHLYLWCPNALLAEGLRIMQAWDLPIKQILFGTKSARMAGRTGAASAFIFATSRSCCCSASRANCGRNKPDASK